MRKADVAVTEPSADVVLVDPGLKSVVTFVPSDAMGGALPVPAAGSHRSDASASRQKWNSTAGSPLPTAKRASLVKRTDVVENANVRRTAPEAASYSLVAPAPLPISASVGVTPTNATPLGQAKLDSPWRFVVLTAPTVAPFWMNRRLPACANASTCDEVAVASPATCVPVVASTTNSPAL